MEDTEAVFNTSATFGYEFTVEHDAELDIWRATLTEQYGQCWGIGETAYGAIAVLCADLAELEDLL